MKGLAVRTPDGLYGRVYETDGQWVSIAWQGKDAPQMLTYEDLVAMQAQVLTLDGWLDVVVESEGPRGPALIEDLALLEVDRRPFKRAASIGPGPKHGRKVKKQDYWRCKGSNYKYKCKGFEGERKTIKRDPGKKSEYNAIYKQWHRARLHKAAPGHFIGHNKKDMARKAKRRAKLQKLAKKRRIYK